MGNAWLVILPCLTFIFHIKLIVGNKLDYFTPNYIYHHTKLNYISCLIFSLLAICINPIYCIPMIIVAFVDWIIHVGRKN